MIDHKACWEELEDWLEEIDEYAPMANDPPSRAGVELEKHMRAVKQEVLSKMTRLEKKNVSEDGYHQLCWQKLALDLYREHQGDRMEGNEEGLMAKAKDMLQRAGLKVDR